MPILSMRAARQGGARALVVLGLLSSGCSKLWQPYLTERLCPGLEDGEYRLRISGALCWESPRPHGNFMNRVFTVSPTDAWAVSSNGSILRWDGTAWNSSPSGRSEGFGGIWATAGDDAWAVGAEGGISHWDGLRWSLSTQAEGTLFRDLKGTTRDNAFAVGDHGAVWRWDGVSWSNIGPVGADEDLYGVWTADAATAFAVSEAGNIWRWNGSGWKSEQGASNEFLLDVWGFDTDRLWTAGSQGSVQRRGESGWSQVAMLNASIHGLWGASENDIWIAGDGIFRTDGTTFVPKPLEGNYPRVPYGGGVHGSAANDVWFAGSGCRLVHWNGAGLTDHSKGPVQILRGIWAADADTAFAVGDAGTVMRWNGRSWIEEDLRQLGAGALQAVWGRDRQNVWTVGKDSKIFKWDGQSWTAQDPGIPVDLYGVWGLPGGRIGAVGSGGSAVESIDGKSWSKVAGVSTETLRAIWSDGASDAWIVGDNGTIARWGAGEPVAMMSNSTLPLTAVWGSSDHDVWITTDTAGMGTILRWDGSAFQTLSTGSEGRALYAVWGAGPDDVWAGGQFGSLFHWNGATWVPEPLKNAIRLNGIAGFGPKDFWMVGVNGAIIRYRG